MTERCATHLSITILSGDAATLRELPAYLHKAGIATRDIRRIDQLAEVSPDDVALALFPDRFEQAELSKALGGLRRARPELLFVFVTSHPRRFASSPAPATLLEKPAFSWQILDAVRGHASRSFG